MALLSHAWVDIGDQVLMGQDTQDFSGRSGYSVSASFVSALSAQLAGDFAAASRF